MSTDRIRLNNGAFARPLRSAGLRLMSRWRGTVETTHQWIASNAKPTVESRRDDLGRFYEDYETLVETLCDCAQYGPTPKLERAYEQVRRSYQSSLEPIRTFLVSYLPENDRTAFDRLATSETVADFLASDDGSVIAHITVTRDALNHYAEHLRQLAARGR
jgi:hypothetical protein